MGSGVGAVDDAAGECGVGVERADDISVERGTGLVAAAELRAGGSAERAQGKGNIGDGAVVDDAGAGVERDVRAAPCSAGGRIETQGAAGAGQGDAAGETIDIALQGHQPADGKMDSERAGAGEWSGESVVAAGESDGGTAGDTEFIGDRERGGGQTKG